MVNIHTSKYEGNKTISNRQLVFNPEKGGV